MGVLVAVLGLLVLLTVVALIARPLLPGGNPAARQPRRGSALARQMDAYADLLDERNVLYSAILELDFDHETGKLTDEEHARQRANWVERGVGLLKRLDEMEAAQAAADATLEEAIGALRDGRKSQLQAMLDTGVEGEIARLRGQHAANGTLTCPVCNTRVEPDDRFCGHCGQPLGPAPGLRCPNCETPYSAGDDVCAQCGVALHTEG